MIRVSLFIVLLFAATGAQAADLCATLTASGDLQYLLTGKSGGGIAITPQAVFPADVKPFVIKADPTFQDQVIELYPLGKDGAGLAIHYEGTLATEYMVSFDRAKGKLVQVRLPDLNPEADEYFEAHVATANGTPILFSTREANGKRVARITSWTGHAWGPVCEARAK